MAKFPAVFAVGDALATYLQNLYDLDTTLTAFACKFEQFSSPQMSSEDQANESVVSIFLHRITLDPNFRAAGFLPNSPNEQPVLFLDLHYLITYWGTSVQAEQTLLAWTMQQLQTTPILDPSILALSAADAGWDPTESIQLTPVDLSLEDILRIWDGFGPKYRLTLAYLARVVRIDRAIVPGPPVVATRFSLTNAAP
jgi:hypothetical protein